MYGAILGDIIGSPFEFDRGDKTKNFDLFSEGCGFTDDSVIGEKDIHMQAMVEASDIGLKKIIRSHTEAMEMVQP